MKYRCNVCGGICDPGEMAGGVCFDCRREEEVQRNPQQLVLGQCGQQSFTQGDAGIKRFFQFEEIVTYMHAVEVMIVPEQADDFDDFCSEVAERIENGEYDDAKSIVAAFGKKFSKENTGFCEDGSPSVEFEAI